MYTKKAIGKPGMVVHACNLMFRGWGKRIISSRSAWTIHETPLKTKTKQQKLQQCRK
jgi:hypothetical protein